MGQEVTAGTGVAVQHRNTDLLEAPVDGALTKTSGIAV